VEERRGVDSGSDNTRERLTAAAIQVRERGGEDEGGRVVEDGVGRWMICPLKLSKGEELFNDLNRCF
jgi:hypothetical protein